MKRAVIISIWMFNALVVGAIIYPHVFGECGWFAPKLVEFHRGMTLCPGQTAHLQIFLPPLPAEDDGPQTPAKDAI